MLCLTLAAVTAIMPTAIVANDRDIAQQIAEVMKISGAMKDYSLSVNYTEGTATLRGTVANQSQMNTAIQIAEASPHVNNVINELSIGSKPAAPAPAAKVAMPLIPSAAEQAARPIPPLAYTPALKAANAPTAPQQAIASTPALPKSKRLRTVSQRIPKRQQIARPAARPVPFAASQGVAGGPPRGPQARMMPISQPGAGGGMPTPAYVPGAGGGVAPASFDQPNLPGYAWPSYASYPNYGGLTYPKQYSPTAWPYIGPFYPYPQVPLGWRKVTLEWDDGWWMLDFKD
jgi:hypothetical protein